MYWALTAASCCCSSCDNCSAVGPSAPAAAPMRSSTTAIARNITDNQRGFGAISALALGAATGCVKRRAEPHAAAVWVSLPEQGDRYGKIEILGLLDDAFGDADEQSAGVEQRTPRRAWRGRRGVLN